MSNQRFVITGTVALASNLARSDVTVQAFDRDLPALERRGRGRRLLGEVTVSGDERFELPYSLDDFREAETDRVGGPRADVSFEVRDAMGRTLRIRRVVADETEYGPDQVLFNVRPDLDVRIEIDAPEPGERSEYGLLLEALAPIVSDVRLAALRDDDVAFILGELSLSPPRDGETLSPVRIEWLRRCAILSDATLVGADAFYGWGRLGLPMSFDQLARVDLAELPAVLERLVAVEDARLRETLLAAIGERIIPSGLRERVDDVVRALKRRSYVTRTVIAELRDAETREPLSDYAILVFDPSDMNRPIASSTVDRTGRFEFAFDVARNLPPDSPERTFVFTLKTPAGEPVPDVLHARVRPRPASDEVLQLTLTRGAASAGVREVAALGQAVPGLGALLPRLEAAGVKTLADIRRRGGLERLDGATALDPSAVHMLNAHVDLDRLSPDVRRNAVLIDKGYDSVVTLARAQHSEFVVGVTNGRDPIDPGEAARLHLNARAQVALLDGMRVSAAVALANGSKPLVALDGAADPLLEEQCGCADCRAALSPAAYLVDLLDYGLNHVRKSGSPIDLVFLSDTFGQPFGELPSDCEAVERRVRQVRLCIEILRRFIGTRPLPDAVKEAALAKAEREYGVAVYIQLLGRLGTSFDGIRLARNDSRHRRRALAERLGVSLSEPRPDPQTTRGDELDQLFLDPTEPTSGQHTLTEAALERLFGLVDTVREPLSDGAKRGDDQSQVTRWTLEGVSWRRNTDDDGAVHVTLANPAPGVFRVELYADQSRLRLVASGEAKAPTGPVRVVSEHDSGLSGTVVLAFTAPSATISFQAVPAVLAWQLRRLRLVWQEQDWAADAYTEGRSVAELSSLPAGIVFPAALMPRLSHDPAAGVLLFDGVMQESERLALVALSADAAYRAAITQLFVDSQRPPFIDPDVVGPDDFRQPVPAIGGALGAFDLWLARRSWVDAALASLAAAREASGLPFILQSTFGTPLPDFDALLSALTGATPEQSATARNDVRALNLSPEAFTRLMALRAKDTRATADSRNEPVTAPEWSEVYSILSEVRKTGQFAAWRAQEQSAGVTLGPQSFWRSLREPREGAWPPDRKTGAPLLDPDVVPVADLPEPVAGAQAITLWRARRGTLDALPAQVRIARETNGFDAMTRMALGRPHSGDPIPYDLNGLRNGLNSADDAVRMTATARIEQELHLSVEDFRQLMVIRDKDADPSPARKPTAAEWEQLYARLAAAHKVNHLYADWSQQETALGLTYWSALKARLPRWRASSEARQEWAAALRERSRTPIVDAHLVTPDDLRSIAPAEPAFNLWQARHDQIEAWRTALKTQREAAAGPEAGLQSIMEVVLGQPLAALDSLNTDRENGQSVTGRLEQLDLTYGSFAYLMRVRDLARANQPIAAAEWDTVYATLADINKQRAAALYREEEQQQGISLSPDHFQLATGPSLQTGKTPRPLWLSPSQARREWLDALRSRIDQERSLVIALREAVSAVEELSLPALRDALITASVAAGATDDARATWVTQRLLIDARSDGCAITTRVGQAIETLQTLVFSLRTGQFKHLDTLPLSVVSDDFDAEWRWMGSYATWRPALLLYLYPDLLLSPRLRRPQTPKFQALVARTTAGTLDPRSACDAARDYAQYFRDVCSLEIEATCQADSRVFVDAGCQGIDESERNLFFMFARTSGSRAYWSTYDPANQTGYAQGFWTTIPPFEGMAVERIVGAMVYERGQYQSSDEIHLIASIGRTLYVFAIVREGTQSTLKVVSLDLKGSAGWGTPVDLSTPGAIASLELVPMQTRDSGLRPGLVFHAPGDSKRWHGIFYRTLSDDGSQWADGSKDWSSFFYTIGSYRWILRAALTVNGHTWFIRTNKAYSDHLEVELMELRFGANPGVARAMDLGPVDFMGALPGQQSGPRWLSAAGWATTVQHSEVFVFYGKRGGTTRNYRRFTSEFQGETSSKEQTTFDDLVVVAPHSGSGSPHVLAYQRRRYLWAWYYHRYEISGEQLKGSVAFRAVPRVSSPCDIPERLSSAELAARRGAIASAFLSNAEAAPAVHDYLQEAYYFVPVHLALELQAAGQYVTALDWFRTVYDYQAPPNERKIYYGLAIDSELSPDTTFEHGPAWLRDPLNPHRIAATRPYAYTRYTIMAIVQCLLAFADNEFTADTPESLPRARTLYLTALDLLSLPELQQKLGTCEELIGELRIELGPDTPPALPAAVGAIASELTGGGLLTPKLVAKTVAAVKEALASSAPMTEILATARTAVRDALAQVTPRPAIGMIAANSSQILQRAHASLLTVPEVDSTVQLVARRYAAGISELIAAPMTPGPAPVAPPAPAVPAPPPVSLPSFQFCVPPNPLLQALRLHAELNLAKLRSCRNIAGMVRDQDVYAAPTNATSGMPVLAANGAIGVPAARSIRPTAHTYASLVERAKQLAQLAAQMEMALLSSLEKRDQAAYTALRARQDLALGRAHVQLQQARLIEANDGVQLANLQQARAQIAVDHYQELLENPLSDLEQQALKSMDEAIDYQNTAAGDYMNSAADPSTYSLSAGFLSGGLGINFKDSDAAKGAWRAALASLSSLTAQRLATLASYERRQQEWQFQEALAAQEVLIGAQQVQLARDHVDITKREKAIADLQTSNAADIVEFLDKEQFTNFGLYDWMSGVLEGVYRFFLQHATSVAKLAQAQLAFQRQDPFPAYIQNDYWTAAPQVPNGASPGNEPRDRKGLTGSARLLQDIYQLDQYAFDTDKRKLQITKTMSLARMLPTEFQRFRDTGSLSFATPMEIFDRDFPGHYLRLIKRVRVSVIALIPPAEGIRATLATSGLSRVVVGPDVFQVVTVRRDPELVALSSPINASGLFDLEPQVSDLLLPFEGTGLDTAWAFQMAMAANRFDYRTIADILMTVEYTALYSVAYRQQVIQTLSPTVNGDRAFSFRYELSDQWYDFHNPEQTSTPMTVTFATRAEDFPPNLDQLKIQHVLLYIARGGQSFEVPVEHLHFTEQGGAGTVGGGATSVDGVISTRRGGAGAWAAMVGRAPVGNWELSLPNTEEMARLFKDGRIRDLLLVISYTGITPEWPS